MNVQNIWKEALKQIQLQVSTISYDLWINSLEPIDFKDKTFYLSTTCETAKIRIEKTLLPQIESALKALSNEISTIQILDPDEKAKFEEENKKKEAEIIDNKADVASKFNPRYTFDNFVVGNSNKYVYAACRGVAEDKNNKVNPLYIYAGVGLGKTHLLNAIGNYITEHFPEKKVLYITCANFVNEYVKSLQGNFEEKNNFKEKYRNLDVFMIDDIQFISRAEATQEEFFNTFNDLYENGKQIVIASDRPPKEISKLQERLRSRFGMGLTQDIQSPDYETRLAIVMKKAEQENYHMSDDIMNYIAEHCGNTNIREMEGILSKVWFYASLTGKDFADMEDLREAIKEYDIEEKQTVTYDTIIDCVCEYFNLKREELLGKKRNKEIVEPRQICMYIISQILDMPLLAIGQIFGRDHTTVIHARDKISQLIEENSRIKVAVNDIKSLATKK